jgi:uncharacterized RDD family membrane protein YckC
MEKSQNQIRPWIRLWARTFDAVVLALPLILLLALVPPELLPPSSSRVLPLLGSLVAVLLEGWLLATWGWTPGKWLLGVAVRDANGNMLNLATAYERSFAVWMKGLGCGFWPAQLILQPLACARLTRRGRTSWDEQAITQVFHHRVGSWRGFLFAICLAGASLLALAPDAGSTFRQARHRAAVISFNRALEEQRAFKFAEAAAFYRRAAEAGLAEAQCNLGLLYAHGQGVLKDETEAVKWYRRAADQGLPEAQFNLGMKYLAGRGSERDPAEAFKWIALAAAQGQPNAVKSLDALQTSLDPALIAEGQRRAKLVATPTSTHHRAPVDLQASGMRSL